MRLFSTFLPWLYLAAGLYAGSLLFFAMGRSRSSLALLWCAFAANTSVILLRGWHFGAFTPLNMVSEQYFLPWTLAALTLGQTAKKQNFPSALRGIAPIFSLMLLALFLPARTIPPSPQSTTFFAVTFFICEVAAHALFLLGGWQAFLFLTQRTGDHSFNRCAVWGFILYSIAQVTGAVWSWLGWSVPFHWSERHLVSAAIWCFYCAYLHLRYSSRWSVREKAGFALCGAVLTFGFSYAYYLSAVVTKHG
jgi:hypothetical protein